MSKILIRYRVGFQRPGVDEEECMSSTFESNDFLTADEVEKRGRDSLREQWQDCVDQYIVSGISKTVIDVAECKRLPSVETDIVQLEVGECECGFHFGFDATFLTQVGDTEFQCPSCGLTIRTADVFTED
jgi:hypothetical protein